MIRNRIDPALKILTITKAITLPTAMRSLLPQLCFDSYGNQSFMPLPKFHFFNQIQYGIINYN